MLENVFFNTKQNHGTNFSSISVQCDISGATMWTIYDWSRFCSNLTYLFNFQYVWFFIITMVISDKSRFLLLMWVIFWELLYRQHSVVVGSRELPWFGRSRDLSLLINELILAICKANSIEQWCLNNMLIYRKTSNI